MFIDSVVDEVKATGVGCYLSSVCVSIFLYADDILLIAPSVTTAVTQRHGKITYLGSESPKPIATKFCMPGAFQDVITPAKFCEDRLRGFSVARGRILAFSTDLLRRL